MATSPSHCRVASRCLVALATAQSTFLLALQARADTDMPCHVDCPSDVPRGPKPPLTIATDAPVSMGAPANPPEWKPARSSWRATSPQDFWGPRFSFGRKFTPSRKDAYYGNVEIETIGLYKLGLVGARFGFEGWGNEQGGGGGLPFLLEAGVAVQLFNGRRSPRFVLAGGFGWEWAYYDRVSGVGQFGIFAPLTNTYVGFDFRGIRLFAEASAQYRWGWGGPDEAHYRLGATLSFNNELKKSWR